VLYFSWRSYFICFLFYRKEFIGWFVGRQLHEYKKAFIDAMEVFSLIVRFFKVVICFVFFQIKASRFENLEYRYSWFKQKYLSQYKDSYGRIFPKEWNVSRAVAEEFCSVTRFTTFIIVFI